MEKETYPPKIDLSTYMDRTVVYYGGNLEAAIGLVTRHRQDSVAAYEMRRTGFCGC